MPIVPPSPNAFSLTKGISYPVSEYTGVPNISIPIYTLTSKSVSVPIELNYHASGIKVNDVASNVGLGWSLNAGGVITRVRQGRADFATTCDGTAVYNTINDGDGKYSLPADLFEYGLTACDGEPDIFYFNFLGRGGRFIMNRDGAPTLLPFQHLQIKPAIGPMGEGMWTITDENGIQYIFGKTAGHREKSQLVGDRPRTFDFDFPAEQYTSTWYLSEIHDPFNNTTIHFEYSEGPNTKYRILSVQRKTRFNDYISDTQSGSTAQTFSTKYLKEINSKSGTVKFEISESERLDLNGGRKLNNIHIYNVDGKLIKKIRLNHDYFVSSLTDHDNYDKYRLKLLGITDITTSFSQQLYKFDYFEEELLPNRLYGNMDHWGYFNSDSLSGNNIPTVIYDGLLWEGVSKEAHPLKVQANILTKVTNPLGGYTEFTYEVNRVTNPTNGEQMQVGGVRIWKVIESDGINISNNLTTEYKYNNSGSLFSFPSAKDYVTGYFKDSHEKVLFISATSQQALLDLSGAHIGYSHVTKILPNRGIEEIKFHSFGDHPDILSSDFFKGHQFPISRRYDEISRQTWPIEPWTKISEKIDVDYVYIPTTSKFWERGLLKEHFIKTSLGKPIKKTEYEYDFSLKPVSTVFAIRFQLDWINRFADGSYEGLVYYGLYDFISNSSPLLKISEIEYSDYDLNKKMVTTSDFSYWENRQVKEEIISYPHGTKEKFFTQYPGNYEFREGYTLDPELRSINKLVSLNRISNPIEKIRYLKSLKDPSFYASDAELNRYKDITIAANKVPVVESSFTYHRDDNSFSPIKLTHIPSANSSGHTTYHQDKNYEKLVGYDYDNYGNLNGFTNRDGIQKSYIWGYNNSYPIAEVINATSSEIAFTSFENGSNEGNWTFNFVGVDYAKTGKKSHTNGVISKANLPKGNYIVSFWAKQTVPSNPKVTVGNIVSNLTTADWEYFEVNLDNITSTSVIPSNVYLDDLRIFPADARMTTYTYDPLVGMTSQSDNNGVITYYEYDDFQRLQEIKDQEENIVKRLDYHYKVR